jgi:glycosyltransferase involved in cell wall biosynthesis
LKNHSRIELSVVIPHFNDLIGLERLLASISKFQGMEIIIVDDKSLPSLLVELRALCKRYGAALYYNKGNKSAGACRNIGMYAARGTWITFADADDFFQESFFESLSKFFKSSYDVVFFPPISIYEDTKETADRHVDFVTTISNYREKPSRNHCLNLRYNIPYPFSKLIRRKFLIDKGIGFDEVIAANDVMFSTRLGYQMKDFCISDQVFYVITRNKGSLSVNMSQPVFWSRLRVKIDQQKYLKRHLNYYEYLYLKPKIMWLLLRSFRYGLFVAIKAFVFVFREGGDFFIRDYLSPGTFFYKLYKNIKRHRIEKKYHIKD